MKGSFHEVQSMGQSLNALLFGFPIPKCLRESNVIPKKSSCRRSLHGKMSMGGLIHGRKKPQGVTAVLESRPCRRGAEGQSSLLRGPWPQGSEAPTLHTPGPASCARDKTASKGNGDTERRALVSGISTCRARRKRTLSQQPERDV